MNKKNEDRFSMFLVVKSICEKYQFVWENNMAFKSSYYLFAGKIPLIEQNMVIQMANITGITTDKLKKRALMSEMALFIANRMESYSWVTANSELMANVHYSYRDMVRARDTDIVGICDVILSKAIENKGNLADYDVSDAMISDFQNAISSYSEAITKPQLGKAEIKNANENISQYFKEANEILRNRLDLDIEVFKKSNTDFYSEYKTSRMIISSGKRTTSLIVSVKDNEGNGIGCALAIISRVVKSKKSKVENNEIVKKTSERGVFKIYSLREGNYKMCVSKIGFMEQEVSFSIVGGEMRRVEVVF